MSPIQRHIEFLRAAAVAPDNKLGSFSRALADLPRVFPSEAGEAAVLIAGIGRSTVKQMTEVVPPSLRALRDVVALIANALEAEAVAHPDLRDTRPYHLRD